MKHFERDCTRQDSYAIGIELSNKFRNMAFVSAMFVLLLHSRVNAAMGTGLWWFVYLVYAITSIAVPFFFFCSGYFLAGRMGEVGWWKCAVKKRLITLGLPYLIWGVLFFIVINLVRMGINYGFGDPLWSNGVDWSAEKFLYAIGLKINNLNFIAHPLMGSLWFIRTLLMFVVFSVVILRMMSLPFLCVVFLLYAILSPWEGDWACGGGVEYYTGWRHYFRFFISLEGLFYFSCGIYMRLHSINLRIRRAMAFCLFSVGFLLSFGYGIILVRLQEDCPWAVQYLRFFGLPLMLAGIWGLVPSRSWAVRLIGCAFPIYLLHVVFLKAIRILFEKLAWLNSGNSYMGWIVLSLTAFIGSVLVALTFRRFLPNNVNKVLWGGR